MNTRILLSLLISLIIADFSFAQVTVTKDTIYITGGTFTGAENAGLLETTIMGDVDSQKARLNPNRVYALYEGQVYYQDAPINVNNPTGTLTIVGIPDPKHPLATTKPIILILETSGTNVPSNQVYGSIKLVNIHYQSMHLSGILNNELFYCGTSNQLPQSLTIDNCLFEFCNIDLFDCSNEPGAIGGWPYGAKFRITNSYFRNMFQNGQWWGSRVFQCKHPIDTLWVENSTFTTGGLLFLQTNQLTDFTYINHNTIINNKKYWMTSPYKHIEFITNNIFVNQNWVGEDTNEINGGNGPSVPFISTINIDTDTFSIGNGLNEVQKKYWLNGDSTKYTTDLSLYYLMIYISNNINYDGPELTMGYYKNSKYLSKAVTPPALVSYLDWFYPGPTIIRNIPGEWMNTRTKALFTNYSPARGGGFIEENTITTMPQTTTSITLNAATIDAMAQWNQNQYADPAWPSPLTTNLLKTNYIYGDYDPTTLPGLVNGEPSDKITGEGPGIQVGIRTFTDLTENFYQSAIKSTVDGLPIGSLIWNDNEINSYNSKADFKLNIAAYSKSGCVSCRGMKVLYSEIPSSYSLSQNYPNPFNPTTTISYTVPKSSLVTIKVYDLLGREVTTLVNENKPIGNYSVQFNANNIVSGVYFYRMQVGEFVQTKKLILLK